jgi:hypothetical protein
LSDDKNYQITNTCNQTLLKISCCRETTRPGLRFTISHVKICDTQVLRVPSVK